MPQVATSSGKHFEAASTESLLDAALRAKVSLGHSCRTGRCQSCRSRVLSGTTQALHDELGLSDAERAEGWVLTCVRAATSDVLLEAEDLGDVQLPAKRTLPCRIDTIDRLTADVLRVRLRMPPRSAFTYHAGQYVEVIGPEGLRRSYSIANAPRAEGQLELHIARVEGGQMSRYWFEQAQVNDLLRINGPQGTFFLRGIADRDLVFLATGTGIAPVKAMLEALPEHAERPRSVRVLWGARHGEHFYLAPQAVANGHTITPVLSRPDLGWKGERGHVQEVLLSHLGSTPDWSRMAVYACGSPAMTRDASALMVAAGLASHRFHSDAFVCSA